MNLSNLVYESDPTERVKLFEESLQQNNDNQIRTYLKCRDGSAKPINLCLSTIFRNGESLKLVFLQIERLENGCKDIDSGLAIEAEESLEHKFPNIIGKSERIRQVCRKVGQVANTDSMVLIQGESGTGKEIFAQAIHCNGQRAQKPFIRVNCAALSETLLESELFGHVKGAFTGAIRDRKGRFRQADGGTILLDEIGCMSLSGQTKLLRVLQERELEPVGSSKTLNVDVRVIATTNIDLVKAVEEKRFRDDLFYRLSVITIQLPPLRERKEDILLLANHFFKIHLDRTHKKISGFSPNTITALLGHSWPGNVRELENAIEHAVVVENAEVIRTDSLPTRLRPHNYPKKEFYEKAFGLKDQLEIVERQILLQTLVNVNWVRKNAAEILDIDPRNFTYFLKKHDILIEAEKSLN